MSLSNLKPLWPMCGSLMCPASPLLGPGCYHGIHIASTKCYWSDHDVFLAITTPSVLHDVAAFTCTCLALINYSTPAKPRHLCWIVSGLLSCAL
jgi:hypothetical protein